MKKLNKIRNVVLAKAIIAADKLMAPNDVDHLFAKAQDLNLNDLTVLHANLGEVLRERQKCSN